jgi:hypothetical protein
VLLLAAPVLAGPRVRLMMAVPTADAYEQVMALVHDGRLTAMDGEAFVVVGEFEDAREGHALGRSLQRRLPLPFELVYDPLHPQADLAWASQLAQPLAARIQPLPPLPGLPPLPPLDPLVPAEPLVAESLIFLYAYPQTTDQEAKLARYLKQSSLPADTDGVRVGVYRETPKALRAFRLRQAELLALGISVQSLRRSPGSSLSLAAGL